MADLVTRFPNGICDATEDGAFAFFAGLRPSRYIKWWEDFFSFLAANWILTETAAGSTELVVSGQGGVLAITNVSAGATDEASIQWAGGSAAVVTDFTFDATKDMILSTRLKVDDATNTAFIVGLGVADTTPVATLPSDGVFFNKVGASTALLANLRASSVSQTVSLGAMADNTYVSLVFRYQALTGYWQGFLNDVLIGSITAPTSPSAAMAVTIGLLNASAAAHVLSIDYLLIAQQR